MSGESTDEKAVIVTDGGLAVLEAGAVFKDVDYDKGLMVSHVDRSTLGASVEVELVDPDESRYTSESSYSPEPSDVIGSGGPIDEPYIGDGTAVALDDFTQLIEEGRLKPSGFHDKLLA